jgi:hypothetical protein
MKGCAVHGRTVVCPGPSVELCPLFRHPTHLADAFFAEHIHFSNRVATHAGIVGPRIFGVNSKL